MGRADAPATEGHVAFCGAIWPTWRRPLVVSAREEEARVQEDGQRNVGKRNRRPLDESLREAYNFSGR